MSFSYCMQLNAVKEASTISSGHKLRISKPSKKIRVYLLYTRCLPTTFILMLNGHAWAYQAIFRTVSHLLKTLIPYHMTILQRQDKTSNAIAVLHTKLDGLCLFKPVEAKSNRCCRPRISVGGALDSHVLLRHHAVLVHV